MLYIALTFDIFDGHPIQGHCLNRKLT